MPLNVLTTAIGIRVPSLYGQATLSCVFTEAGTGKQFGITAAHPLIPYGFLCDDRVIRLDTGDDLGRIVKFALPRTGIIGHSDVALVDLDSVEAISGPITMAQPTQKLPVSWARISQSIASAKIISTGVDLMVGRYSFTGLCILDVPPDPGDSGALVISGDGSGIGIMIGSIVLDGNKRGAVVPLTSVRADLGIDI